ncbi:hypothetical protein DPMN_186941 [Dreissena polymorpha]|uniref:Uncharacterized protein n=1 Tax=Dreissena polymorpha TaxID=45954 RepID=A0A9D4DPK9_DREPO|nr:hypothetical protein DPMN_186941 [Dreissena polymorpha]
MRTNLLVEGLSLKGSKCGSCSAYERHPERELGRLRMILHRCFRMGKISLSPVALVFERPAERPHAVAEPTRSNAGVSLPPGGGSEQCIVVPIGQAPKPNV